MQKPLLWLFILTISIFASELQAQQQTIKILGQVQDETNGSPLKNVLVSYSLYDYELMKPIVFPEITTDWMGYFWLTFDAKHINRAIRYTLYKRDYLSKAGQFILQPADSLQLTMYPLKIGEKPVISVPQEKQLKTPPTWERILAGAFILGSFFVFHKHIK